MATLDSAAMVVSARGDVGRLRIPQGQCLNWVWTKAGAVQSIPPALGRMDTAFHAWEAVEEADRRHGDIDAPAGLALFFGPSPTRTDRNRDAGDVTVALGGRLCAATDANGAYIGIMTIEARAREIQRPFLGASNTLGGHRFSAAETPVTPTAVIAASTELGVPLMSARLLRIESTRGDGSYDEGFADPDGGGYWTPVGNDLQARVWRNLQVPRNTDVQNRAVISGFLNTKTGKRM